MSRADDLNAAADAHAAARARETETRVTRSFSVESTLGQGVWTVEIDADRGLVLYRAIDSRNPGTLEPLPYLAEHPDAIERIKRRIVEWMAEKGVRL